MVARAEAPSGQDLDDVTLARAQRGEAAAFEQLVRHHQGLVWSYLWRMMGGQANHAVVQDLFQETFLGVHRSLAGFTSQGPARLSTWILAIATRVALHRRRTSRRDAPHAAPAREPDDEGAQVLDLERRALLRRLIQALDELAPEQRAVFVLREFHELPYEEVARALDLELGTVRSRLSRAREALRLALEKDAPHG